jgi:hypothetical protein
MDRNRPTGLTAAPGDFQMTLRRRQKLIRRAAAFTGARDGDRAAVNPLLAILDRQEGANAAGHLSRFSGDPRVFAALEQAVFDPEPLVRAVAAQRIESKTAPAATSAALKRALADPVRSVRVGALLSLVNMRAVQFSGEDAQRFERTKQEYLARAEIQADDGSEQLNIGTFSYS